MLAERAQKLAERSVKNARDNNLGGWTTYQGADRLLQQRLDASQGDWQPFADSIKRREALDRFHAYVHQWY